MRALLGISMLAVACGSAAPVGPDAGSSSTVDKAPALVGAWSGTLAETLLTSSGTTPYATSLVTMVIASPGPNVVLVTGFSDSPENSTVNTDGSFSLTASATVGAVCQYGASLSGTGVPRDGGLDISLAGPVSRQGVYPDCPPMDASMSMTGTFQRLADLVVPKGLSVEEVAEANVTLHWQPDHVPADQALVQMNVNGGAWQDVQAFDVTDGYALVELSQYQPELSTLGFRVELTRGTQESGFCPAVYWKRPVSPPLYIAVIPDAQVGQDVTWEGTSAVATAAILDRGLATGTDGGIAWENVGVYTEIPGTALVTGFLEDQDYWYRVTYAAGQERSHSLAVDSRTITFLDPPQNLQATTNDRKVDLLWMNVSQRSNAIFVYRVRSPGGPDQFNMIAQLPQDATSYSDVAPFGGTWTYFVEARGGTSGKNTGDSFVDVTLP